MIVGASALVILLALVLGNIVLHPGTDDASHRDAMPESPAPPDHERLFLTGVEHPDEFTLADPSSTAGHPLTVRLTAQDSTSLDDWSLGLSFDARELANPMWGAEESNLALTLDELDRPALRFGGNGIDRHVWWTSSDEPAPEWASVTVTPADLERIAAVADEVDATVTIDLDLGHDDPARAADMAAHAHEAFGDRLLAVAIGNEPNGFFHPNQPQLAVRDDTWTPESYQESLREYSAAIESSAPGLPIAGPGAYDAPWWRAFAESDIPNQRALSMHWYPLWDCDGPSSSPANPEIEDLVSPGLRDRAQDIVTMGSEVADSHGLPLWMEETGPTSCPGTNETSLPHAQALWTVDYTLTLADLGVERVAFHSTLQACRGGAPMSPICARGDLDAPGQIVEGRSSFLALMLLSEVPHGTALNATTSGDGEITTHAVMGDDGALTLVIVDRREPQATENAPRSLEFSAPEGLDGAMPSSWEVAEGSRLSGDSLDSPGSQFAAMAPVRSTDPTYTLAHGMPLPVVSDPGTVTLLRLAPADPTASDGGHAGDQS